MKGMIDMVATPGPGSIFAQIEGITGNAQGLQGVADQQSSIMGQLGSTFDALGVSLQGQAGTAAQGMGQNFHAHSGQMVGAFQEHSHMMNNNAALHVNNDEHHAHILGQVSNLT
jgi:uncharacterized protein YukE